MQINFQGIVIQKYDSGDNDLVLHLMSPSHGKLSIIAKHAKKTSKRFGSRIDLFDQGSFWVSQKKAYALHVLTTFEPLCVFKNLRFNMDKLVLSSVLAETVDLLVKEGSQHDAPIYNALVLGLQAIDESTHLGETLRAAYLSFSHILGHAGINDMKEHQHPSTVSFLHLIEHLESFVEKRLKTKYAFLDLIEQFKKEKQATLGRV